MVWKKGQQLQGGKYIIDDVLGRGGFGITYRALHVQLDDTVVIKTPDQHLKQDPEYNKYVERFIKEGRIMAQLSRKPNPHIVRVRDLFEEDETHCLVMDFVSGESLFEVVNRKGTIPEAEVVPFIRQIGKALAIIHQAGLVHRDAHPGNIMLQEDGTAVLIDFGIAKELIPTTQSSTGIAGNPGFAPYEQMVKGSREPNVDIYCLAATLYYALTGQLPPTSLNRKLYNDVLTPPKRIIPGISNQLNQAILQGMALEAKNRPQSMNKWLNLLEISSKVTPSLEDSELQPTVRINPKPGKKKRKYSSKQQIQKVKNIPWFWLALIFLYYMIIGIILILSNVGAVAVVGAVAGAGAGAVAWRRTLAVAVDVAVARASVRIRIFLIMAMAALVMGVTIIFIITSVMYQSVLSNFVMASGAWFWALLLVGGVPLFFSVKQYSPRQDLETLFANLITSFFFGGYFGGFVALFEAGENLLKYFSGFKTFLILTGTSWLGLRLGWLIATLYFK